MEKSQKESLRDNRWVDVPMSGDVRHLLEKQLVSQTYYRRGDGEATRDLNWVESNHRKWVSKIIDLSEFPHCYFVNGTTDAIHHWKLTDKRPWQKLCYGEYEFSYFEDVNWHLKGKKFNLPKLTPSLSINSTGALYRASSEGEVATLTRTDKLE